MVMTFTHISATRPIGTRCSCRDFSKPSISALQFNQISNRILHNRNSAGWPRRSRPFPDTSTTCTAAGSRNGPIKALTPHSGYHFDGSSRRFFEGWYFKVSLSLCQPSSAAKNFKRRTRVQVTHTCSSQTCPVPF